MSGLEEQCLGLRLPRQVLSPETLKANIGAQVGTVRATTWPRRIVSGCSRAKTTLGGLLPSTGRRTPIRASEGVPRKSLKKPTSLAVVLVSLRDGRASVID